MAANKCVFLDRDGVINKDYVDYVYDEEKLEILPGVVAGLQQLKAASYLLIIITNQSGIAKEIYTRQQMHETHRLIQEACGHIIDHIYYAPWHPSVSESLTRKPDSLMLERAMARYKVNPAISWMVGDKHTDMVPARKVGLKTIQVDNSDSTKADYRAKNLPDAISNIILA